MVAVLRRPKRGGGTAATSAREASADRARADDGTCGRARYVVRVGDTAIEFGDDFHDETLARVVRVLRAC